MLKKRKIVETPIYPFPENNVMIMSRVTYGVFTYFGRNNQTKEFINVTA